MTRVFRITEEELLMVEHGCIHPETDECVGVGCRFFDKDVVCRLDQHSVANDVRTRNAVVLPSGEIILDVHNICKLCDVAFGSEDCGEATPYACLDAVTDREYNIRKDERNRVIDEVVMQIKAWDLPQRYDYEATLCSAIIEGVEALRGADVR